MCSFNEDVNNPVGKIVVILREMEVKEIAGLCGVSSYATPNCGFWVWYIAEWTSLFVVASTETGLWEEVLELLAGLLGNSVCW